MVLSQKLVGSVCDSSAEPILRNIRIDVLESTKDRFRGVAWAGGAGKANEIGRDFEIFNLGFRMCGHYRYARM